MGGLPKIKLSDRTVIQDPLNMNPSDAPSGRLLQRSWKAVKLQMLYLLSDFNSNTSVDSIFLLEHKTMIC